MVNTRVFKDNRGWLKKSSKKIYKKNLVFTLVSSSKKNFTWPSYANKKPQDKFLSVLRESA